MSGSNGTSILCFIWNADGLSLCGNNIETDAQKSIYNTVVNKFSCVVADFFDEIMALVTKIKPEIVIISTVDESETSKFHSVLLPEEMKRRLSTVYQFFDRNRLRLPSYHTDAEKIKTGTPIKSVIRSSVYIAASKIKLYSKIEGLKDAFECKSSDVISGGILNRFKKSDSNGTTNFNIVTIKLNDVKELESFNIEKDNNKYLEGNEDVIVKNILNRACLINIFGNLIKDDDNINNVNIILGDFNYMIPIKDLLSDNITIADLYQRDQLKNNLNKIFGKDKKYEEGVNYRASIVTESNGPEFLPGFRLKSGRAEYLNPFLPFSRSKEIYKNDASQIDEVGWRERIVYYGNNLKCLQYSSVDYGNTKYSRHAGVMAVYVVGSLDENIKKHYGGDEESSQLDYITTEINEKGEIIKGIYGNDSVNYIKFNKICPHFFETSPEEFLAIILHTSEKSEELSLIIMAIEFYMKKGMEEKVEFFRNALADRIYNTENKYYNNFDIGFFNIRVRAIKHKILGIDFDKKLEARFAFNIDNNYVENKSVEDLLDICNFEVYEKMSDKAFSTLFKKLLKEKQYEICKKMAVTRENKFLIKFSIKKDGNSVKINKNDDIKNEVVKRCEKKAKGDRKIFIPSYIRYISNLIEICKDNNYVIEIENLIEIKPYYLYKIDEKFYLKSNILCTSGILSYGAYAMFYKMNKRIFKGLKVVENYDLKELRENGSNYTYISKNFDNVESIKKPIFNKDILEFMIMMERNREMYHEILLGNSDNDYEFYGIKKETFPAVIDNLDKLVKLKNIELNNLLNLTKSYPPIIELNDRIEYIKYKAKNSKGGKSEKIGDIGEIYKDEVLKSATCKYYIRENYDEVYWNGIAFAKTKYEDWKKHNDAVLREQGKKDEKVKQQIDEENKKRIKEILDNVDYENIKERADALATKEKELEGLRRKLSALLIEKKDLKEGKEQSASEQENSILEKIQTLKSNLDYYDTNNNKLVTNFNLIKKLITKHEEYNEIMEKIINKFDSIDKLTEKEKSEYEKVKKSILWNNNNLSEYKEITSFNNKEDIVNIIDKNSEDLESVLEAISTDIDESQSFLDDIDNNHQKYVKEKENPLTTESEKNSD